MSHYIKRFPTLDRETVYACLLYFEQNRSECLMRLYTEIARKAAGLPLNIVGDGSGPPRGTLDPEILICFISR